MNKPPCLVWFRLDLRLADNPALHAAIRGGCAIIPIFIWAPEEDAPWEPGGASRWWLHQSLAQLRLDLHRANSRLIIRRGASLPTLRSLIEETGAAAVFWNRRYEPAVIARDQKIAEALRPGGVEVESFNGALLNEPSTIQNKSGKPFQVFTAFWKHCLAKPHPAEPLPGPRKMKPPQRWPQTAGLETLQLEPRIDWAEGLRSEWRPGEAGAHARLKSFLKEAVSSYQTDRNRPDLTGTSRLSPHLHFGEITPRQVWHAVKLHSKANNIAPTKWRKSQFLTELYWREFAHHLLYHFPHTVEQPLRAAFKKFPWRKNAGWLKAWQRGATGYPIIDAGMRELWKTGWLHNRVRMIVASFLVKDLFISWQAGARWFWDTLVDADLAQNTLGWQWSAGCGADAAPYFRIFNPLSQGEKFDPHGAYVRRWCPELAQLPNKWIHQPWKAPREVLERAGIQPGKIYPKPIVNHTIAREVALEAFAALTGRLTKAVRSAAL